MSLIKAGLIQGLIFGALMIMGSLFWNPNSPWVFLGILALYFIIPFRRLTKLSVDKNAHKKAINKPAPRSTDNDPA